MEVEDTVAEEVAGATAAEGVMVVVVMVGVAEDTAAAVAVATRKVADTERAEATFCGSTTEKMRIARSK